ncbi:hypothetical protein ACFVH7_11785 [Kitasatospora indigofera]|uniref:hypothetical protein n=1 Tax=Kitasatospora indigofera TaxID=67307 RepID=UPI0036382E2A
MFSMARARDLQTLTDTVEPVVGEVLLVPDSMARRALSVVASYARDADDCRFLLEVLGLMPEDGQVAEQSAVGRAEVVPSTVPGQGAGAGSAPAAGVPLSPLPDDSAAVRERRRLRP